MNPDQIAHVTAEVAAAWPNPEMTDLVIDAWADVLRELDYGRAIEAVRRLVATSSYRPTPGDVAEGAGMHAAANRALDQYLDAMRRPQAGALDPAVRRVMDDLGGWSYCHAQPVDWHHRMFPSAWRRRFANTDPLTQPMGELEPGEPIVSGVIGGTRAERKAYASARTAEIRAGWAKSSRPGPGTAA